MTSAPANPHEHRTEFPFAAKPAFRLSDGLYVCLFAAFGVAAVLAPVSDAPLSTFISVLFGSAVAIFLVWNYSDRKSDDLSLVTFIFCGMVTDGLFNTIAAKLKGGLAVQLELTALIGIANLGVLATAIGVGLFVGRGLKKPNYLVMAAIVGAISDCVSVYAGPSKHVNVSNFFQYLSFQWGLIGHNGVIPIIGAGDFIFLTLFFYGSRKFGLDDRKTLVAMIVAITIGFGFALLGRSVPALPFMSAALLLTHGQSLLQQMRLETAEAIDQL